MKKRIFAIIGSASRNSSNEKLVAYLADMTRDVFDVTIFNGLKTLPHFDPEQSLGHPPRIVAQGTIWRALSRPINACLRPVSPKPGNDTGEGRSMSRSRMPSVPT